MKAFIRGTGIISPQKTFYGNGLPEKILTSDTNLLRCVEPSYLEYLNPVMARRMGRVIKMGITSAMICLKDAQLKMPDAIITGTALGCLGDTEKFLTAIIADDEQYLTPTSFIQSIQNTVSAQIALQLNCTGHNFTFVHKGFSFESALLDSLMLIAENEADNVLVGGIDEMTNHNYFFYDKLGIWKKEKINSSSLLNSPGEGTIGGEGSAFFVLSKAPSSIDYAQLLSVKNIYNPSGPAEIESNIKNVLRFNKMSTSDIDLVIYGNNGDIYADANFNSVMKNLLAEIPAGYFKHLCGEYQTAGAFAMWLAAIILKTGKIPESVLQKNSHPGNLKNILIYNAYENNHSLYLLTSVK